MKPFFVILLTAYAFAAPIDNAPPSWTPGQEVKTTSGTVKGRPAVRPGFSAVSEYVGIPYAQAPLGGLRWAPPKAFKSDALIDATKWVRANH